MTNYKHPMWFILFFLLGISISIASGLMIFVIITIPLGIIAIFVFNDTPSSSIKFTKNNLESLFVWVIVLLSIFFLFVTLL